MKPVEDCITALAATGAAAPALPLILCALVAIGLGATALIASRRGRTRGARAGAAAAGTLVLVAALTLGAGLPADRALAASGPQQAGCAEAPQGSADGTSDAAGSAEGGADTGAGAEAGSGADGSADPVEGERTVVTPVAPAFTRQCFVEPDVTLPDTTGVIYDSVRNDADRTLTVTARPASERFMFPTDREVTTEWVYDLSFVPEGWDDTRFGSHASAGGYLTFFGGNEYRLGLVPLGERDDEPVPSWVVGLEEHGVTADLGLATVTFFVWNPDLRREEEFVVPQSADSPRASLVPASGGDPGYVDLGVSDMLQLVDFEGFQAAYPDRDELDFSRLRGASGFAVSFEPQLTVDDRGCAQSKRVSLSGSLFYA